MDFEVYLRIRKVNISVNERTKLVNTLQRFVHIILSNNGTQVYSYPEEIVSYVESCLLSRETVEDFVAWGLEFGLSRSTMRKELFRLRQALLWARSRVGSGKDLEYVQALNWYRIKTSFYK